MTLLAPRIGNDVSYATWINDEIHFAWQAQQFVVTFWEIGGVRNVTIFHTKCVSKMGRVRSPKRRVRDDDFIVGYRRIILESSFFWRRHFKEFPLKS